jgi:hypothetical protein
MNLMGKGSIKTRSGRVIPSQPAGYGEDVSVLFMVVPVDRRLRSRHPHQAHRIGIILLVHFQRIEPPPDREG